MPAVYAQLSDVEQTTGVPLDPEDAPRIEELLEQAEIKLGAVVGDLPGRVLAGYTTAERLKTAVVGMVRELLRTEEQAKELLSSGTSTAEERASVQASLVVGRRERWLAGARTAGSSVSLSAADDALRYPVLPRPEVRRPWR